MTKASAIKCMEPGVYFGLNETAYHADPSLGSTDHRSLIRRASSYWWHSWMNPAKKEKPDTKDQIRGTAAHKYVLEGAQAFEGFYMRRPDDPQDATSADKSAVTKKANATAAAQGRQSLHGDDFDRIMIASKMIVSNPELQDAFVGGIPEISVFWITDDGIPCKCRFDYTKPRATTDLKSIKNLLKTDFERMCLMTIAQRDLPMQAAHYLEGRAAMRQLAKTGAIFGKDYEKQTFDRIIASDEYAFGWVFYQADDAPETWGKHLSPGNPILDIARDQINEARRRWKKNMEKFGADMWIEIRPFEELDISELHSVAPWYGMR